MRLRIKVIQIGLSVLFAAAFYPAGLSAEVSGVPVFAREEGGYHTFRIPALIVSHDGTLLAFCEGRKHSASDTGDIALVMKTSTDSGASWSPVQVVWDDPGNTCGNPCAVADRDTGVLWLLMTWNLGEDREDKIIRQESRDTRRVFITSSSDNGKHWSEPTEITQSVKKPNWTWYATGPGNGIQKEKAPHPGRLVIPCDHIEADTHAYYSHVIYSDDHGRSWHLGGSVPEPQVNECCVAELSDGSLLLNMRNYHAENKVRQKAYSTDGGVQWEGQSFDFGLIEPVCQASLVRYPRQSREGKDILFFSNPASAEHRKAMTLRASTDGGQNWEYSLLLRSGPGAYSSLAVLPDGSVACLYECGETHPYEQLRFVRVFPAALGLPGVPMEAGNGAR